MQLSLTSLALAAAVSHSHYHLEALPAFENPGHFQRSEAIAMNDLGEVTGISNVDKSSHAFLYSHHDFHRLLPLGAQISFSLPRAINSYGIVVGSATADKQSVGFVTSPAGEVLLVKPLAGDSESSVTAVRANGDIAGISRGKVQTTAFFATAASHYHVQPLGFPHGSTTCRARAMGSEATVYGDCETAEREPFAVLWPKAGEPVPLPSLPDAENSRIYGSAASATGDWVVGSALINGLSTATRWNIQATDSKAIENLGTFLNDDSSEALAVNSAGLAVGYSSDQTVDHFRAVAFENGEVIDLNTVVDTLGEFSQLTFANSVNTKGEIVGTGILKNGGIRGFLLTPTDPHSYSKLR